MPDLNARTFEMRPRFFAAKVSTSLILLCIGTSAYGLSCAPNRQTLQEAYDASDSIIVGVITGCEEEVSSEPWAHGGSNCTFNSLEVLKDASPVRDYTGLASSSGCGLSLRVGEQYLLFLNEKNRPLPFSTALANAHPGNRFVADYLEILRGYRNGTVADLAEPWTVSQDNGVCTLSQFVGWNSLMFNRLNSQAPHEAEPLWTERVTDGQSSYSATKPLIDEQTGVSFGDGTMTVYGMRPDVSGNTLRMIVNLREPQSSSQLMRTATISVGSRTWPLHRVEIEIKPRHSDSDLMVHYYTEGNNAEQILAAMKRPSDIRASAVLQQQEEGVEPEIRLSSRSTRLAQVIGEFTRCTEE